MAALQLCQHSAPPENLMDVTFISRGVLRYPSGMESGWVHISIQAIPASPSPLLLFLATSWHPLARGWWCWALCMPSSLGTAELQIPGVENPWAEVTQCESGWVSMALARGAGGEASGEVSTTSSAAARSSQELSGVMFPMTAIPTLLVFSFLWTFPCTQSFLKESQEEGNVPVVTLAVIAPGNVTSSKNLSWGRGSSAAPGTAELVSPCPLLTSVP